MNGSCLLYYICLFIPCQPLVFVFSQKRSPPKWAWWFLLRGISYPRQCLDCQCSFHLTAAELAAQTVDGYFAFGNWFCIYFFCLIYGHRLPCCPLCYSWPNRSCVRPIIRNLPMSNRICYDEKASHDVYCYPKRFEKQSNSCFSQRKNWNIRSIIIGVTHQMTCCSCPNLFYTIHKISYGGPGGHCPRVLNPFLFASYSNNSQYIFIFDGCQ